MSPENQKKLWQQYYDTLAKGVDLGYNPKPEMYDPKLAHSLKYDIARFSAFKETSFRKQLESALTKDGKIVPWSEFKKTADVVSGDYNKRWLKTEYNHTVATANMAEQWQGFEADKDLYPNLKYVTSGDARVRDAHKILDGVILPIDHPFWKSHTTPLDWGCRCNVEQTDDEPSKVIPSYKVKEEFQNNAFYTGKVFNGSAYESGLSDVQSKEIEIAVDKNFNKLLQKNTKLRLVNGGVTVARKELNTFISFTSSGIKESFNQPHYNKNAKNLLISTIDSVLMKAKYLGSNNDFKENPMVAKIHIFLTYIDKKKTYLINRELITGEIHFYSISDGDAILTGIKK